MPKKNPPNKADSPNHPNARLKKDVSQMTRQGLLKRQFVYTGDKYKNLKLEDKLVSSNVKIIEDDNSFITETGDPVATLGSIYSQNSKKYRYFDGEPVNPADLPANSKKIISLNDRRVMTEDGFLRRHFFFVSGDQKELTLEQKKNMIYANGKLFFNKEEVVWVPQYRKTISKKNSTISNVEEENLFETNIDNKEIMLNVQEQTETTTTQLSEDNQFADIKFSIPDCFDLSIKPAFINSLSLQSIGDFFYRLANAAQTSDFGFFAQAYQNNQQELFLFSPKNQAKNGQPIDLLQQEPKLTPTQRT